MNQLSIKINELRVGNYVMRQSDKLHKEKQGERTRLYKIEKIVPQEVHKWDAIPLTGSILESCGFNMIKGRMAYGDLYIHYYLDSYSFQNGTMWREFGDLAFNHDTDIKYLHQLQNYYFAIEGQELKIEL